MEPPRTPPTFFPTNINKVESHRHGPSRPAVAERNGCCGPARWCFPERRSPAPRAGWRRCSADEPCCGRGLAFSSGCMDDIAGSVPRALRIFSERLPEAKCGTRSMEKETTPTLPIPRWVIARTYGRLSSKAGVIRVGGDVMRSTASAERCSWIGGAGFAAETFCDEGVASTNDACASAPTASKRNRFQSSEF